MNRILHFKDSKNVVGNSRGRQYNGVIVIMINYVIVIQYTFLSTSLTSSEEH